MNDLTPLIAIVKNIGIQLKNWHQKKMFDGVALANDFKAEVDQLAHQQYVTALKKMTPDIPVISEEDLIPHQFLRPSTYWLIDPLDGTSSFVKGFNTFVTQVALIEHQKPVIGIVYAPMFDQLYTAQFGYGAYLNGQRLRLDAYKKVNILIDNTPKPQGNAALVAQRLGFSGYVECGSIGLKICRVADGSADLFFKDVVVRDWDIAAPMLILQEAGGIIMRFDGRPFVFDKESQFNGLVASVNISECQRVISCLHQGAL